MLGAQEGRTADYKCTATRFVPVGRAASPRLTATPPHVGKRLDVIRGCSTRYEPQWRGPAVLQRQRCLAPCPGLLLPGACAGQTSERSLERPSLVPVPRPCPSSLAARGQHSPEPAQGAPEGPACEMPAVHTAGHQEVAQRKAG